MTGFKKPKQVADLHYSDSPYFLNVSIMNISDSTVEEVFSYFYGVQYKEVEQNLDPLYDEMHFYRTNPKENAEEDESLYLLKTRPQTDDWGNRILYIFCINTYCDLRGAIFN